jgi:U-box domain
MIVSQRDFVLKTDKNTQQIQLHPGSKDISPSWIKTEKNPGETSLLSGNTGTSFLLLIVSNIFQELLGLPLIGHEESAFFIGGMKAPRKALKQSEEYFLPTNNAKLQSTIFEEAKQSGILPNKFKDPVTRDVISTPVAFVDDPSCTIYDLETIKLLQQENFTQNPIVTKQRLDFNQLVYLPKVKKQIDELTNNI